jgi:hypothetical protein
MPKEDLKPLRLIKNPITDCITRGFQLESLLLYREMRLKKNFLDKD